ncbi:MAG: beta-ketoacyl reductase [Exilibacterium sp.]
MRKKLESEKSTQGVEYINLGSILKSEKSQAPDVRFYGCVRKIFSIIQNIIKNKLRKPVLIQLATFCHPGEKTIGLECDKNIFSALYTLVKIASMESSKIIGQQIEFLDNNPFDDVLEKLRLESAEATTSRIRYHQGSRWKYGWYETEMELGQPELRSKDYLPWKDNGVYLITGGLGGIGQIVAKEIAQTVKAPVLLLVGRSAPSRDTDSILVELNKLGATAAYIALDICNQTAVSEFFDLVEKDYDKLNGIIHCAGVTQDSLIINKAAASLEAVMGPKVSGVVNLDIASRECDLDFLLLFSSISASLGSLGQIDYAAGNAFMDAYTAYRNELVEVGKRRGRTISINWPLWQDGGMSMEAEVFSSMHQEVGLDLLATGDAIAVIYYCYHTRCSQLMVLPGNPLAIRRYIQAENNPKRIPLRQPIAPPEENDYNNKILIELKRIFGEVVKFDNEKIDVDEELESYGLDSIMIKHLNRKLSEFFPSMQKTLFFETGCRRSRAARCNENK